MEHGQGSKGLMNFTYRERDFMNNIFNFALYSKRFFKKFKFVSIKKKLLLQTKEQN